MKLAFYKGKKRLVDRLIQWWLKGPYSHVELVFKDGMCGTSSVLDKGVRLKNIEFNPDRWDFLELNATAEEELIARQWFERHAGEDYDWVGILGFIIKPFGSRRNKWICSEAVLAALRYEQGWRLDPCSMFVILSRHHS